MSGAVDRPRQGGVRPQAPDANHGRFPFVPLVFFKYTDFLYRDVLVIAFGVRDKPLDLPLPLGVSFVTFRLTAFVVDTYKSKFPPSLFPRIDEEPSHERI